jgi:hypothetical protein
LSSYNYSMINDEMINAQSLSPLSLEAIRNAFSEQARPTQTVSRRTTCIVHFRNALLFQLSV